MAQWCVLTRQSPTTFYECTLRERDAFLKAVVKLNRRR